MTPTTYQHEYRNAYIAGMERGGRICASEHAELVADARQIGAAYALGIVLLLALVAGWLGRRS